MVRGKWHTKERNERRHSLTHSLLLIHSIDRLKFLENVDILLCEGEWWWEGGNQPNYTYLVAQVK